MTRRLVLLSRNIIERRTRNPFFLEELVNALVDVEISKARRRHTD